ncbi:RNA polymerase II subunit A C-terminal domain phosphatase, partial [Stylosanthes scabra]|nr:RNA polymerase II subunit A C-terminal domain phosphatase [Stylosanthes scabra]
EESVNPIVVQTDLNLQKERETFLAIMTYRYAMVCSSNQNRSMEAHFLLKRQGFDVSSYGTGAHVKLPGPSLREPNVYDFGTPYKQMFDDLRRKDPELYPFHSKLWGFFD